MKYTLVKIIRTYKIVNDIFFFSFDKLYVLSFMLCQMFLQSLPSWCTPLSMFVAPPLAFFFFYFIIIPLYNCRVQKISPSQSWSTEIILVEDYYECKPQWTQSQMQAQLPKKLYSMKEDGISQKSSGHHLGADRESINT